MNRKIYGISALLAVIIFSSCVAIPEDPPPTAIPRPQRDLTALASALAKLYRVDNVNEIHDRLTDLEECLFEAMEGETMPAPEESDTAAIHLVGEIMLTPEEWDAMFIHMAGSLQTAARFYRFEAFKEGTVDTYYDTESEEEQFIQELDWTIDACYGR